jgi:hypothetical protein
MEYNSLLYLLLSHWGGGGGIVTFVCEKCIKIVSRGVIKWIKSHVLYSIKNYNAGNKDCNKTSRTYVLCNDVFF